MLVRVSLLLLAVRVQYSRRDSRAGEARRGESTLVLRGGGGEVGASQSIQRGAVVLFGNLAALGSRLSRVFGESRIGGTKALKGKILRGSRRERGRERAEGR